MTDTKGGLTTDDFVFLAPSGKFIFLLTRQPWVKAGVDAALAPVDGMPASAWLMQDRCVQTLPKRSRMKVTLPNRTQTARTAF